MLFYLMFKFQLTSLGCVFVGGGMGGGFVQFRLALFIFLHHQDARYQLIYKNAILGSLR